MADGKKIAFGIGIGCLAIVGLMAILAGACGVWVASEARRIEREMEDPELRGNRVLEVLGTDRLPEGYYPMTAFSVPFVMDTALLTDRPPAEGDEDRDRRDEGFDERGFIYVKILRFGQDEQELRDYFEGRTDDVDVLSDNGINVDVDEIIGRGVLDTEGGQLMYVGQRGAIRMADNQGGGIASITLVECDSDSRLRIGIWFGPDPDPDAPVEEIDVAGTPADPGAITAFYRNFRLCG